MGSTAIAPDSWKAASSFLPFEPETKFKLVDIELTLHGCPTFLKIDIRKILGTAQVIHKFDHVIIGRSTTFEINFLPRDCDSYEPDFQRLQAMTDMIEHLYRSGR